MSSVEGMWLMRSSEIADTVNAQSPSVIVLESGKIFGGDSAYYYVGDYKVGVQHITGWVHTRTHTLYAEAENVFGMRGAVDYKVDFSADMIDGVISGIMHPRAGEEVAQWFHMTRLADLP